MIKFSKYFLPYVILLVLIGLKGEIFIGFFFVIFHELVHYMTARYYGYKGFNMEILPIGVRIELRDIEEASYQEDLVISISGPLSNIVLSIIFCILYKYTKINMLFSIYRLNLFLGIFNLVPSLPLDGGRILRDIIASSIIYKKANEIVVKISIIIGFLFMGIYIFFFIKGVNNINIALISLFIIFFSYKEKERIVYFIMGDIIKKKYKFLKRGYLENYGISILYKKDLLYALGLINKNRYNIFTALDEEMKVIDIVFEEELLEGLKNYGNITLEELINMRE